MIFFDDKINVKLNSTIKTIGMHKALIGYESGAWVEAKTSYNREEIEDYAATQLVNKEYMIVSVLRYHSGEPEEFQL